MWAGLAMATQIPQTPTAAVATAEQMAQMRAEHELAIIEHSHPAKHKHVYSTPKITMVDSFIDTPKITMADSVIT